MALLRTGDNEVGDIMFPRHLCRCIHDIRHIRRSISTKLVTK